jgi:hypothetical protein
MTLRARQSLASLNRKRTITVFSARVDGVDGAQRGSILDSAAHGAGGRARRAPLSSLRALPGAGSCEHECEGVMITNLAILPKSPPTSPPPLPCMLDRHPVLVGGRYEQRLGSGRRMAGSHRPHARLTGASSETHGCGCEASPRARYLCDLGVTC